MSDRIVIAFGETAQRKVIREDAFPRSPSPCHALSGIVASSARQAATRVKCTNPSKGSAVAAWSLSHAEGAVER